MITNIKNNTISEADAKQKLNVLDKIKKVETKNKRLISSQKILLNSFDDLIKRIFNNNSNNNSNNNNNENENENDNESENENKNEKYCDCKIKQLNNWFKTIDETKSFEEQIEILKTRDFLDEYWHEGYYHDNKELDLKIFKAKAEYLLNDVDKYLFKEIFG